MKRIKIFCYSAFLSLALVSCQKHIDKEMDIKVEINPEPGHLKGGELAFPKLDGSVAVASFLGETIYATQKGEKYVWMGDIAFDPTTFDSLQKVKPPSNGRTYHPLYANHWPGGGVPFVIETGFSPTELSLINGAIAHVEANTPINFVPRVSQTNYVRFVPGASGSGLYADFVGMKGGAQIINLETNSGFIQGNVIHEIGHILGLYHEQSRVDRELWIEVHTPDIFPQNQNTLYQFQTYNQMGVPGFQIGAFDFNSVMLYGSFAFSNPATFNPTMTRLDGSTWFGQRNGLSAGDIETLGIMYGAPFARLRYVQFNSWTDPASGSFSDDWEVYVDFFSDEACTIPFVTPITRGNIVLQQNEYYANSGYNYFPGQQSIFNVQINSGDQSVHVGTFHHFENSNQGYIYEGRYYAFRLLSAFAR